MKQVVKVMSKKKVIKIVVAALILIAVGVTISLIMIKQNKRTLKVIDVEGDASITRDDIGKIELYKNMAIHPGDLLVLNNGILTLKADSDKYIYFDEKTEMEIEISGTKRKSDTEITLTRGALTCDIKKKLSKDSSYVIKAPAVSITAGAGIFRVEMYEEDELIYTRITVFKGGVSTRLLYKDGSEAEDVVTVVEGSEVLICEHEDKTEYVSAPTDIDYARLPAPVLKRLQKAIDSGRTLSVTKDEIDKCLEEVALVTYKYKEKVFGVQTVKRGEPITATPTDPSVGGAWDYDFSKPVTEDLEIEWKSNNTEEE